ncbi:suppressor of gamma response 1, partial [Tanacetum coccineum]
AEISSGVTVAVKRLTVEMCQGLRQFNAKIQRPALDSSLYNFRPHTDVVEIAKITEEWKNMTEKQKAQYEKVVTHAWTGLPRRVKFDPLDHEIMWHLLAKSGVSGFQPHPFIDE